MFKLEEEENDIMAFETPGGDILIAQSENWTKNLKDDGMHAIFDSPRFVKNFWELYFKSVI